MLGDVFSALAEQQKRDGEVERAEFNPDADVDGWPLLSDPNVRQKIEAYVLRRCIPEHHRYRLADGSQGIVYFDSRGRATPCKLTEIPDAELIRMAKEKGKRIKGHKDPKKPQTGRKDHGYTPPMQEDALAEAMKLPIHRYKSAADQMGNIAKTMQTLTKRIPKDGEETFKKRMLDELQRAYSLANQMMKAAEHMG